jgi:sorbitol-specific phosphotransferase system component IIC
MAKKSTERKEALMRIMVGITTGIILSVWKMVIQLFTIINFFITLFSGKRHKELAKFCEMWNTQIYIFLRYICFSTNQRPFPFSPLKKSMDRPEQ